MTAAPPPRWSAAGHEGLLASAESLARAVGGPGGATGPLPAGFAVVKDRPTRLVLAGAVDSPTGSVRVHVKVRRDAGRLARARRRIRGARSPREGAVLAALAGRGVPVAEPLAWSGEPESGVDVLVLRTVSDAVGFSEAERRATTRADRRRFWEGLGRLFRAAHDAGFDERDVHRGNVVFGRGGPVLLDAGLGPLRRRPAGAALARALGIAAHGLGPSVRDGIAALRGYCGGDRARARELAGPAVAAARRVTRGYRRGRARRATRDGLHFETFRPAGPASGGVRSRDATPASWTRLAAGWLDADPPAGTALKHDGSVVLGSIEGVERPVVWKRYEGHWRDRVRVPRAIRAFRRAYALRIRGVGCPEPLLAVADGSGRGVYVAAYAAPPGASAVDLAAATAGGSASAFAALAPRERRRVLDRLGRTLRRFHDAEATHRDWKAPNWVAVRSARGVSFSVVDLDGARPRARPVSWSRRARDLARLDASLPSPPVSRADRVRVALAYWTSFERPRVAFRSFVRRVAAASRRKRGPSGAPR